MNVGDERIRINDRLPATDLQKLTITAVSNTFLLLPCLPLRQNHETSRTHKNKSLLACE